MSGRYIDLKESAKLIRGALKRTYPGIKFSVRKRSWAGGGAVAVEWTDGPRTRDVDSLLTPYSGKRFDGMIDMGYHVDSWLCPSGKVVFARTGGTTGSMGTVSAAEEPAPEPGAELVHFSGSAPDLRRELSDDFVARCQKAWDALDGQAQCDLLNSSEFPRWPEDNPGRRLALFMSDPRTVKA